MFIVLGATGHIGSELVNLLDAAGEKVIAIVHDAGKADDIRTASVEPIVLDVRKTAPLHALFRRGAAPFSSIRRRSEWRYGCSGNGDSACHY
ncbi:NAD(P)H-binding protein [Shinella zoogloeoides]|uniref:NAD(P)H-binding protein n=1 Tax=Shinella zoogloeoides TaxID=352475 RepID=UPI0028A7980E|nr:NAD(P)H-binding protein [Shinella zoogloeoides]